MPAQAPHEQAEIYGHNLKSWLQRWDAGHAVWSFETWNPHMNPVLAFPSE